jgi:hypothetical protein
MTAPKDGPALEDDRTGPSCLTCRERLRNGVRREATFVAAGNAIDDGGT